MKKDDTTLQERAARLHTHTVVYRSKSLEETVAALAELGWSTKAINQYITARFNAELSPSAVQYRISKAQRSIGTRFRRDYRNGGPMAIAAARAAIDLARKDIQERVAPKFLPLASSRLDQ